MPFVEHEEGGVVVGLALGKRDHATLFAVETVGAERECVLKPVRHQQRWSGVHVALLHDEFDDGVGGDRIEAARGRVVKDELRLVDQGAGNGDAPPHAAGKARRKEGEGLFEADEAQRIVHARVDFLVGHTLPGSTGRQHCRGPSTNRRERPPGRPCRPVPARERAFPRACAKCPRRKVPRCLRAGATVRG